MTKQTPSRHRCAIYTRKSTEDGLEQEFNSLDAQREACEAFIRSQSSLGWKLLPEYYDDGGISGATMDRPSLQRLLGDIRDNKVDVVVVYKVDRLTRSLADFARIVEVLDAAGASFVSVTQQFNTTTSMGRLTLNVLLSFAQFEREVTAERIRDKIAASKQKGMWMGGGVPLGYRAENRKLLVDEGEAHVVRYLFSRYLELRSVRALAKDANEQCFPRRGRRDDQTEMLDGSAGGSPAATRRFGRGQLYHVLSNPIYVGKVRHYEKVYEGEHQAIIDHETFASAQALLVEQAPARRTSTNSTDLHLLTGIHFDQDGNRLSSVHTKRGDIRYRYYVSSERTEGQGTTQASGWRLAAKTIEAVVEARFVQLLEDRHGLSQILQPLVPASDLARALMAAAALKATYKSASAPDRRAILRKLIQRIDLAPAKLTLHLDIAHLAKELIGRQLDRAETGDGDRMVKIECSFSLRRRGIETKLVLKGQNAITQSPDDGLVKLLARANTYIKQLTDGSGRSISDVAAANGIDRSDFSRALKLAFLAPDLVDRILNGSQPPELTAQKLSRLPELPHAWSKQRALLDG